jgi:hypothetical protein
MLATATATSALMIAIVALAVSIASLAAILVGWRRSRARVAVSWDSEIPVYRDGTTGPRHVAVSVTNNGHRATTLVRWEFTIDGSGEALVDMHPEPWNPEMPQRIGPQDCVTLRVPVTSIAQALCNAGLPHASLHACVCLANDRWVFAPAPIEPAALSAQPIVERTIDLRTGRSASDMTARTTEQQR